MLRSTLLLMVASVLALTLGACATDAANQSAETEGASSAPVAPGAASDAASQPAEPATSAPSDTATSQATGGGPATVTTGEAAPYGAVLTDGTGMTLYVFFEDGEGQSMCYDACAENWPPLLTDGDPAAEGDANGRLLGTLRRDDGTTQVTYDGQPLYLYAGDSEPGDVRGFGSGNVWYPVTPDGAPIDATGGSEPAGGEY
jgi:predicted lipoprotein with Yx(FWY)xxD motif